MGNSLRFLKPTAKKTGKVPVSILGVVFFGRNWVGVL